MSSAITERMNKTEGLGFVFTASGFKRRRVSMEERSLKMEVGAHYIPKINKLRPRGEDAYFVNEEYDTIGVADGVGGWAKRGVDAGEYARMLMGNSVIALSTQFKGSVNPLEVLEEAYMDTTARGSSTACIITLQQDNYLHAANVGDSGFVLFRDGEMVYKSPGQQRDFNCPYQLGRSKKSDTPSSAQKLKVEAKAGDLLVAGTDGLFDNMFISEMQRIIESNEKRDGGVTVKDLAWMLALVASYNSYDEEGDSPHAEAKRLAGLGENSRGGKIDDITVLVARILPAAAAASSIHSLS